MAIDKIPSAGIESGGVAPSNLSTGGPYWDTSGNVGIGTSSPLSTAMLEVSRSTTVIPTATVTADAQVTGWRVRRTGGTYPREYYMGIRENSTALDFYDNTADALRARIDSSGRLLINTTSAIGGDTAMLHVAAASGQSLTAVFQSASTVGNIVRFYYGATQVGNIGVTASATSYNTSSDYRLKENVQPMQGALAKIAELKPCTYTWKADGSAGEGFIAHELAEVFPGAVTGEKDALKDDGSIDPQGIDTSFLVATLTAAIQELKAEVDALRAQVEAK
jgi:hypothetical protein